MVQQQLKKGLEEVVEKPKEETAGEQGLGSLRAALKPYGIDVSKFKGEHGIDPAVVMQYHKNPDGATVYLCREETTTGSVFYTLTASEKISDWKEIIKKYHSG